MRKFKDYPVVVNYNTFTADERAAAEKRADAAFDQRLAKDAKFRAEIEKERKEAIEKYGAYSDWQRMMAVNKGTKDAKLLEEVRKDSAPSPEAKAYEDDVEALLKAIEGTELGKLLLKSISPKQKVWIVPTTDDDGDKCDCVAATSPGAFRAEVGGGVRIRFSPGQELLEDRFYADDEVLFHELVHGYRGSWLPEAADHRNKALRLYLTEEEVIAVCMTNVYRSAGGALRYYKAHLESTLLSKDQLYDYLAQDGEALEGIRHFLNNDRLAMKVAKWRHVSCNPWRDFSDLQYRFQMSRRREIDCSCVRGR